MNVTSYYTKRAWIRDDSVPSGQPANGHYNCECGRNVEAGHYGQGPDMKCECGIVYDNHGWIARP